MGSIGGCVFHASPSIERAALGVGGSCAFPFSGFRYGFCWLRCASATKRRISSRRLSFVASISGSMNGFLRYVPSCSSMSCSIRAIARLTSCGSDGLNCSDPTVPCLGCAFRLFQLPIEFLETFKFDLHLLFPRWLQHITSLVLVSR
jgi:hypothetical protein